MTRRSAEFFDVPSVSLTTQTLAFGLRTRIWQAPSIQMLQLLVHPWLLQPSLLRVPKRILSLSQMALQAIPWVVPALARSSVTKSVFSRVSQLEKTLAKVDKLEDSTHQINSRTGLLVAPSPTLPIVPAALPEIAQASAAGSSPSSQRKCVSESPSSSTLSASRLGDVRPSTRGGASSDPATLHEIGQPISCRCGQW
jgi:hypothetical protein